MDLWSITGIIVVVSVLLNFISSLGKRIPIIELMLLIAGLQWIIGPIIEYNFPTLHYRYYMYVEEPVYMSYVVPAYLAFTIAIWWVTKSYKSINLPIDKLKDYKQYGLTIFIIGVVFDITSGSLPGSLGFFAFIVANFKFSGAIILYFSEDKRLKKVFYFALLYLFFSALQKAMFHDLILWSVFFFMFWAIKNKPSQAQIYLIIFVGFFSLSTLQTIKSAYRSEVWSGYQGNKVELFVGLFIDALLLNNSESDDLSSEQNNVRLNQGWIISAIMHEIPFRQDFLEGETVVEAISASILPRFLNPGKKKAGGQENFELFTGLQLAEGTSMGISIIGEAYGNFKVYGGILFMGVWGWFLARYWGFLVQKAKKNILLLAFLPIIFLQVVKAETELVVVLNHLIKASIVVFLFFWIAKQYLSWELEDE